MSLVGKAPLHRAGHLAALRFNQISPRRRAAFPSVTHYPHQLALGYRAHGCQMLARGGLARAAPGVECWLPSHREAIALDFAQPRAALRRRRRRNNMRAPRHAAAPMYEHGWKLNSRRITP